MERFFFKEAGDPCIKKRLMLKKVHGETHVKSGRGNLLHKRPKESYKVRQPNKRGCGRLQETLWTARNKKKCRKPCEKKFFLWEQKDPVGNPVKTRLRETL